MYVLIIHTYSHSSLCPTAKATFCQTVCGEDQDDRGRHRWCWSCDRPVEPQRTLSQMLTTQPGTHVATAKCHNFFS